ncbi:transposable element Tc3 transposase [Trichonephila clavipes]|nr:transposable element Tc3 transposase [Trichonephila clavipes]
MNIITSEIPVPHILSNQSYDYALALLRISWTANSPDLNPIEHVWDMLGRPIAALSHPPSSVTELKRALQEARNRLSPQLIHHLIASMINRCAACLAVRGDHTPY